MKEFLKNNTRSMINYSLIQTLDYEKRDGMVIRWSKTKRCQKIGEKWGQFLAKAYSFYSNIFNLCPSSELLILSKADWDKVPFLSSQLYGNPRLSRQFNTGGLRSPNLLEEMD